VVARGARTLFPRIAFSSGCGRTDEIHQRFGLPTKPPKLRFVGFVGLAWALSALPVSALHVHLWINDPRFGWPSADRGRGTFCPADPSCAF
jgi:hypothetical protein